MIIGAESEVTEEIKSIYVRYCTQLIDCAVDKGLRQDFLANPRYYLTKKIGMKIPDTVEVLLDDEIRWPVLHIKTDDEDILVLEKGLALETIDRVGSGEITVKDSKLKKPGEIHVKVNKALNNENVKAVVVMPYYDIGCEVLGEIDFSDGSEVILSSP